MLNGKNSGKWFLYIQTNNQDCKICIIAKKRYESPEILIKFVIAVSFKSLCYLVFPSASSIRISLPQETTRNINESVSSQNNTSDVFTKWCLLFLFDFFIFIFTKTIIMVMGALMDSLTNPFT